MQRSLGGGQREADFFTDRQEAFTMKMTEMGMDVMAVKDFCEDIGLHEENPEILLDQMGNPNYRNVLRANFQPPPNLHAGGYAYMDPQD